MAAGMAPMMRCRTLSSTSSTALRSALIGSVRDFRISGHTLLQQKFGRLHAKEGRHDPCILPRAVPVVEAMVSMVLADLWLHTLARPHHLGRGEGAQ